MCEVPICENGSHFPPKQIDCGATGTALEWPPEQQASTEIEMPNGFANSRPRLDADAVAQWLDEVGMPIVLAGALMTMVATIAG